MTFRQIGWLVLGVVACESSPPVGAGAGMDSTAGMDATVGSDAGAGVDAGADAGRPEPTDQGPPAVRRLRVMTFNGGTTDGLPHDRDREDGYTSAEAAIADALYENSLSWNPAEAALTAFLAAAAVDVVVFQEIFHDPWCAAIQVDPALDFVCRDWTPERPWQVERLLGPDFQVACADGQPDNCLGVRRSVGALRGCPLDAPCEGGLAGAGPPSGCSRGARIGRALVDLAEGGELVVINAHGTSGFGLDDQACRVDQFRQIFVDAGAGRPAADGALNLVMGDFNTDPVVLAVSDPSAAALAELAAVHGFHFLSPTAREAPATYYGVPLRIDHVLSDGLSGECVVAGGTVGVPAVMETVYWDHRPVICDVRW
jgi:hypothetical protein